MPKAKPLRFAANLQKIAGYANTAGCNERGYVIGEGHPKATLSNHEVDLMRELHEEFPVGHPQHMGYRRLAKKFEVTKTAARKICTYHSRAQYPVAFTKRRGT
jgi:hypothetical protein